MISKRKYYFCLYLLHLIPVLSGSHFAVYSQSLNKDNTSQAISFDNNGTGALSFLGKWDQCGLGYTKVAMKVSQRWNDPPGNLLPIDFSVSGIPAGKCVEIIKAYVWWSVSYRLNSSPSPTVSLTNPDNVNNTYTATMIGDGPDKCWGPIVGFDAIGTRAFRADVTNSVQKNGNYTISISNGQWETDGFTLMIIYREKNSTFQGHLMLYDGAIITGDSSVYYTIDHTSKGLNVCEKSDSAIHFLLTSDLQAYNLPPYYTTQHQVVLNMDTLTIGSAFWNFDETTNTVTKGQDTVYYSILPKFDCYATILAGTYYKTYACMNCPDSLNSLNAIITKTDALCGQNNGQAEVKVSGSSNYSITWNTSPPQNSSTISGLSPGVYKVTITDSSECSVPDGVTDSIVILNNGNFNATVNISGNSCTDTMPVKAAINVNGDTALYTFWWNPGAYTFNTIQGLTPGNYSVEITDSSGCKDTLNFTVDASDGVSATASINNVSCYGMNNGRITLGYTSGTPPFNLFMLPGNIPVDSLMALPPATYSILILDSAGCSDTLTATITEPKPLTISSDSLISTCKGDSVWLKAIAGGGTGNIVYTWDNTSLPVDSFVVIADSSVQINVYATDSAGCKSNTTLIHINPINSPSVIISGDSVICEGDTLLLVANANMQGGNFNWQPALSSNNSLSDIPLTDQTYSVIYSNNCGKDSSSIHVSVKKLPDASSFPDSASGCSPLCVTFGGFSSDPQVSCLWNMGNGVIIDSCNFTYCYKNTGQYEATLTIRNKYGCKSKPLNKSIIKVGSISLAKFDIDPPSAALYQAEFDFINHSENSIGWKWYFMDQNNIADSSLLFEPTYIYSDTGKHCIKLIAYSPEGCTDTTVNCLTVNDVFTLYTPDAFTPNEDEQNETFYSKGTGIKEYEIWIFDRWGNQVFYCTSSLWPYENCSWNGKYQNGRSHEIIQQDVYVYYIKALDLSMKSHEYIGHISLIR